MTRRAFLVLVVLIAALTSSSAANAALSVPVEFCSAAHAAADDWVIYGYNNGEDRCSIQEGLQIDPQDMLLAGDQAGWSMGFASTSQLVSYSFDIEGGDTSGGNVYAASSCSGCGADVTISSRAPGAPLEHFDVLASPGSDGLWIYAECTAEPFCFDGSTPARISNIVVNFTDETPPTIGGSVNGVSPYPETFSGWTNKATVPMSIAANDPGSGVRQIEANISGLNAPAVTRDLSGDCASDLPLSAYPPCPYGHSWEGEAVISSLADGIHDVTFSALDAFGNTATTAALQLGVDRSVPAPPGEAALDFVPPGWPGQRWTSDPDVVMSWAMTPPEIDPELESPYDLQDVAIHRDGSPTFTHETHYLGENSSAITLPADGEWDIAVRYLDEAGNVGDPATKSVGLDADAPFAPQNLSDIDWLSSSALSQGKRITWDAPDENPELDSGVCGYVVSIDDSPSANPIFGTDDSTIKTSWPLSAGLDDGTHYFHVRAVSCAGVASETATAAIHVDTQAPEISLDGLAPSGVWANRAQTAVISAADATSDVAKVGFAFGNGAITWTSGDSETVAIPEGAHHLTAYAVDVAGNTSALGADVKTDTQAPAVQLENESADDPTRVSATVTDADAGLFSAAIELRRVDAGADSQERQWQPLGGAEAIARGTTDPIAISRVLDDSRFALGDYELRVNAVDLAGNGTPDAAFAIRSARLPLRRLAEISAAVAAIRGVCRTKTGKTCASVRKCPRKARCQTVQVVDRDHARESRVQTWSQKAALVGDALDAGGAPIAGVPVTISSTAFLHEPEPVGSATTDASGHYELILPRGPSRTFTARIGGSLTQQPASAEATLNVRSDIRFTPRPRSLRSGHTLSMNGRVLHPEWLPVGGISVSFEWYSPTGWTSFAKSVPTDAKGNFTYSYPWRRVASNSSVKLRARVDQTAGWPFAPGSSDPVRISVLAAR